MKTKLALLFLSLASFSASAVELGYGINHTLERSDCCTSARGLDLKVNWGGNNSKSPRYSGDRWSISVGHAGARRSDDGWIGFPLRDADSLLRTDDLDGYEYITFTHRWYTDNGFLKRLPQVRFFVATGFTINNAEVCGEFWYNEQPGSYYDKKYGDKWGKPNVHPEYCYNGTVEVSSNYAFVQEFGFKWRERVELIIRHDSTAKLSEINLGDNMILFTILGGKVK